MHHADTDKGVTEKIFAAKGRPSDNPLIIHISDPKDAEKFAVTESLYYKLADAFMPGPLTVILPKKDSGSPNEYCVNELDLNEMKYYNKQILVNSKNLILNNSQIDINELM